MSLKITPFEQSFGSMVTGIFCTVGAKGNAATIVSRANTALAVGEALESLSSGDISGASAAILALVNSKTATLDPAVALALNNALQIAFAQWQALQAAQTALPFLSASVEAVIENFAAGVVAGANAELAKYPATSGTAQASEPVKAA